MVAGGNTPLALYAELARRRLALSHLNIFALDEYIGVPAEDSRSCANLIRRTVVDAWGIPARQYHHLSPLAAEAQQVILRHEELIRASGGIDLAILGLGRNGHLGFNEPGSERDGDGRVLELARESVEANRQWFGGDYAPSQGVTTGMKTLLAAKCILMLAFGRLKSQAVAAMIEGAPTSGCPASFLQRHHNVAVFLDSKAASELNCVARPESSKGVV
jgi:glucosamine-6-phosphate deaminase